MPLLHHSQHSRRSGQQTHRRSDDRSRGVGPRGGKRAPHRFSGHQCLRCGHHIQNRFLARPTHEKQSCGLGNCVSRARYLGPISLCVSLPPCRSTYSVNGRGKIAFLYRYAAATRCSQCVSKDEATSGRRKNAGSHIPVAKHLPRINNPLHFHRRLPRRNRRGVRNAARLYRGGAAGPGWMF